MTIVDKTIHAASGAFRAGVELPNTNMTLPAGLIPFLNQGAIFVGSVVANPHVHIVRSGFLLLAASISSLIEKWTHL